MAAGMSESVADDAHSLVTRQETRVQDCAPDVGAGGRDPASLTMVRAIAKLTVLKYPARLRRRAQ